MLRSLIGVIAWVNLLYCASVMADSSGFGSGIELLTKIQGAWKTGCHPVGGGSKSGYVIKYLNVNFTNFEFKAHVYSDEQCRAEVTQWPATYQFGLGVPLRLPSGESVFELNLTELKDPAEAWNLYPANIIKLVGGQLFLGSEYTLVLGTSARLIHLNLDTPFIRR